MEQRETEQRNGTNGIEMERILVWHGYHSPVSVGEGSFSQVYRVTDSSGGFRACRVSDVTEQWQRECENWQEIRHPLFPGYVEHWTEGGKGYLIMEFWDGMDLRKMLERRGRLTPGHAAWIADQIAEGIQYLHERQHPFLYRDLKPDNVMIDSVGTVKIIDFGATRVAGLEEVDTPIEQINLLGAALYAAPEYFLGERGTQRSDLYSLGVALFEMLAGKAPLRGESAIGTLVAHIRQEPADVRKLRPETPPWLAAVVARLLAKDRERRYATAAEVLADLEARRARRAPVRVGRYVVLGGAAAVALLLAALVVRVASRREES